MKWLWPSCYSYLIFWGRERVRRLSCLNLLFRRFGWHLCPKWSWRGWWYQKSSWVTQFTIFFRWVPSVFLKRTDLCREGMMWPHNFGGKFNKFTKCKTYCLYPERICFQTVEWLWYWDIQLVIRSHQAPATANYWMYFWVLSCYSYFCWHLGDGEYGKDVIHLGSYASGFFCFMPLLTSFWCFTGDDDEEYWKIC